MCTVVNYFNVILLLQNLETSYCNIVSNFTIAGNLLKYNVYTNVLKNIVKTASTHTKKDEIIYTLVRLRQDQVQAVKYT